MYENRDNRVVVTRGGLSLGTIGLITWIVFMILDYGCHVEWLNQNNPCPHFWTWFPLWAPIALWLALVIIITVIVFIITLIAAALDK